MKKFNLTHVKMWPSRNGAGLSCTLTLNDQPVCDFYDIGDGSQPRFDVKDQKAFNELEAELKALPPVYLPDYDMHMQVGVSGFIDALNYALETKTPFTLLDAA